MDFAICPSCGTQFGYDDANRSYDELRQNWIDAGALWFSPTDPPANGWNGYRQLLRAGLAVVPVTTSAGTDQTATWGHMAVALR